MHNAGYIYEVKPTFTVRVSSCSSIGYKEWAETKWEGPLEEWYKALYDNAVKATEKHLEDKLGRIERNQ
jgi:hypothetical protein